MKTNDDDAARQVLADQLSEAGDPRGEYINLELALAVEDGLEQPRKKRRRDQLLELHGAKWRKGLKPPKASWWSRRGIFDQAQLEPALFAKHAKAMPALRSLNLDLDRKPPPVSVWKQLASLSELAQLDELEVSNNRGFDAIGDEGLAALLGSRHLDGLVTLRLSRVTVEGLATVARAQLGSLRRLHLGDSHFGTEGIKHVLKILPRLEELRLEDCNLGAEAMKELARAKTLPKLRLLDLGRNKLGPEGARALARLELPALRWLSVGEDLGAGAKTLAEADFITNLEHLSFSGTEAPDAAFVALCKRELPSLITLDVSGYYSVQEKGIIALAKGSYPSLRSLSLAYTGVSTKALKAVAAAQGMPQLARLDLLGQHGYGSSFGDDGARALAATKTLTNLTQLVLNDQDIGPVGAAALGAAKSIGELTVLELRNCRIGPKGATALFASPKLGMLESLNLDDNKIGPTGARALASMKKTPPLVELSLRGNELGDAGMQALAAWEGLAGVELLALSQNRIKGAGAKALAASPHVGAVGNLIFDKNKIGDEGALALAKSKNVKLETIWLEACGATATGIAAVKKRWPNVRISS